MPSLPGASNPQWGGGIRVTHHGYVMVKTGTDHPLADVRGYVYLHQLVVAAAGVDLTGVEIDHQNGDRRDNRFANLAVRSKSEHSRRHTAERPRGARGRWVRRGAAAEVGAP